MIVATLLAIWIMLTLLTHFIENIAGDIRKITEAYERANTQTKGNDK